MRSRTIRTILAISELVRGQGYRLLPRVEVLPNESPARHRVRWTRPVGAAVFLVVAAALVFWIVTAPTDTVRERSSIAVLPFVDLSPAQDQQYLAEGCGGDINLLSKATTLRVIARTSSFSFRGKDADVTRIAEALGVTHVLEGSVRKAGDQIRVRSGSWMRQMAAGCGRSRTIEESKIFWRCKLTSPGQLPGSSGRIFKFAPMFLPRE